MALRKDALEKIKSELLEAAAQTPCCDLFVLMSGDAEDVDGTHALAAHQGRYAP